MADYSTTDINFLDDKLVLECFKGERILTKSPALAKQRSITTKYFGVPLKKSFNQVEGNLKDYANIKGNQLIVKPINQIFTKTSFSIGGKSSRYGWKIPSVLYITDKHFIIAPANSQFLISKMMHIVGNIIGFIFFILLSITSIIMGNLLFFIFALSALAGLLINVHLFFIKKGYLSVAPLSVVRSYNPLQKTILIEGEFDTGVPSFLKNKVSAELYLGDNLKIFVRYIQ